MRCETRRRTTAAGQLLPAALRLPAVALLGACAAVTAALGLSVAGQSHAGRLDTAVDTWFSSALDRFPALLSFLYRLGTLGPVTVMTVALVTACVLARRWSGAVLAAVAVPAASSLTEYVLKPLVGRTLYHALTYPSGHATSMFALAGTCAVLLLCPPGGRVPGVARLLLALLAMLLAVAVAAAMVAIGAHYFTDAVAGAAVGTGTVLACALIIDQVTARLALDLPQSASRLDRRSGGPMSGSFTSMFRRHGYAVARDLFPATAAAGYRDHFMWLWRRCHSRDDLAAADRGEGDPLRRYPRMMHMHRWDPVTLDWLLAPRIAECLRMLLGAEPYAVQSMFYFKPPGARGQAPHQDNFYLRVRPGTCIAAWMAVDAADEDNGCLLVVPGSHRWPILCTSQADTATSFTDVTVPLPAGTSVRPVLMSPGDVLFFNGSLVHGSEPNRTRDRFRRSLIGHYVHAEARQVAAYYHPALAMDGTPLPLEVSPDGGPCGVWVERDGRPSVEMTR